MWILGNPIKIEGSEFSDTRAIFICNHASPIDIFLVMWLTPIGTVGIAKKEVSETKFCCHRRLSQISSINLILITCIFFPDHLVSSVWAALRVGKPSPYRPLQPFCCHRISERGCTHSWTAYSLTILKICLTKFCSWVQAAHAIVNHNLSLIIFPEGTRSRSGRLLPFKKVIILTLFAYINASVYIMSWIYRSS